MDNVLKIQGINSKGYGIISKLVMQDRNLSRNAKCIYAYFCSFAGTGTTAFPSVKKICYDLNFSDDRTYRTHLNQLINFGYITVNKTRSKNGKFDKNIYILNTEIEYICPDRKNTSTVKIHTGKKPVRENSGTNNNKYNKINNKINNNNNIEKKTEIPTEINALTENGFSVSGFSVNGFSENDKPATTNKELKPINNKLNNNNNIEKKSVVVVDNIIKKFKEKYSGTLDNSLVEKLIKKKTKEVVEKCIEEFENYVNNADQVEKIFYDFCMKWNTDNAYKKNTSYSNNNYNNNQSNQHKRPYQATLYEQREYDDEFWDSLYERDFIIK